jgi:hypothetical protein
MILVAARGDLKDRDLLVEGAPQRALGATQPPTGLIHVQVCAATGVIEQVLVGLGERLAGARQDLIDRAGAPPCLMVALEPESGFSTSAAPQGFGARLSLPRPFQCAALRVGQLSGREIPGLI